MVHDPKPPLQVTIDSVLANSKTQNAFLFTVNAILIHDYPLAVEPGSTPRPLVQKKTWRDSLPIDMLLSAVPVLVVAQSSSEIPEGLMNNPVLHRHTQNQNKADTIKTRQRLDFHILRTGKLSLVCVSNCVKTPRCCNVSDWVFIAYH